MGRHQGWRHAHDRERRSSGLFPGGVALALCLLSMGIGGGAPAVSATFGGGSSLAQEAETPHAPSGDAAGSVRGVIRAAHKAALAAGITARIAAMPFREGEAFRKGALLVSFECDILQAALKGAKAAARAATLKARSKRQLLRHMAAGRLDVAVAAAEAEKAAADVEAARARVKECSLRAPWSGRVAAWNRQPHETPSAGEEILTVVSTEKPEVDIIVPASWLAWLKPGLRFTFDVDGMNLRLEGRLVRIGAVVDPVSQTVKVTGRMAVLPESVRPGMGGVVRLIRRRARMGRKDPAREERRMP